MTEKTENEKAFAASGDVELAQAREPLMLVGLSDGETWSCVPGSKLVILPKKADYLLLEGDLDDIVDAAVDEGVEVREVPMEELVAAWRKLQYIEATAKG